MIKALLKNKCKYFENLGMENAFLGETQNQNSLKKKE